MGVTVVLVAAAIVGVNVALKRDEPSPDRPLPPHRTFDRPEIPTTDNPELDQLLREAQETLRGTEERLHHAEENGRRVEADLVDAIAKKAAADRAKAEFDAAHAAPMGESVPTPAPPGK